MPSDIFERLARAGAGMGTRDPTQYSFMLSVADAIAVSRRIQELTSALLRITSIIETQSEPDIDAMHDVAREALNK